MSLREDYSGNCSTGFTADMALVFQAGRDLVAVSSDGVAASATIHQNDLDDGATPGDVSIQYNAVGVVGNSVVLTGDGVKTIATLATENNFTVLSGDDTQILEDGDVIQLTGGVDAFSNVNTTLSTGLAEAASKGETDFTINVSTAFETANLRLEGIHMETYFAGIVYEMANEGIYSPYFTLKLNTSDTIDTSINFIFTL